MGLGLARRNPHRLKPVLYGPKCFRKILIANRGEIALRVIEACKELGIATVAVYSEADRNSLHVRFADEAVCIGPPRSNESYLNIPASDQRCGNHQCRRHPSRLWISLGKRQFRGRLRGLAYQFIGPSPELLRMMGEKDQARREMAAAGVQIVPGSQGIIEDEAAALTEAAQIKYPVIVKASAGGGGRGMRVVRSEEELPPLSNGQQRGAAGFRRSGHVPGEIHRAAAPH